MVCFTGMRSISGVEVLFHVVQDVVLEHHSLSFGSDVVDLCIADWGWVIGHNQR